MADNTISVANHKLNIYALLLICRQSYKKYAATRLQICFLASLYSWTHAIKKSFEGYGTKHEKIVYYIRRPLQKYFPTDFLKMLLINSKLCFLEINMVLQGSYIVKDKI